MAYPDDFIPEIWSTSILDNLKKALVLPNVVDLTYAGDIANVGDTVRIQGPTQLSAAAYVDGSTTVTYGNPASTTRSLVINQDYYVSFGVDDLDEVQSNVDLLTLYTRESAYALAKQIDTSIAAEYANAGLAAITVTIGTTDVYDAVIDARTNLEAADNTGDYFVVVNPAMYGAMLKNTTFVSAEGDGAQVRRTGVVGAIGGMDVYVSNNLSTASATTYGLYGSYTAIAHARQLIGQPEAIRLESSFKTGVRARLAWGNKVVDSNRLGTFSIA